MSAAVFPSLAGLGWAVKRTPKWSSTVQEAISGKEIRVALWTAPRWQWELTYDLLRQGTVHGTAYAEFAQLAGFFNARQGQFDSFLYLDADDSAVTGQGLGSGDGVTTGFPLVRAFGGFVEPILAPNTGAGVPFNVYLNGTVIAGAGLTPPAAAALSSQAGGALAATTYYVTLTYVTNSGETAVAVESSLPVAANCQLVIASPAAPAGAIGWNAYVASTASGGSSHETLQNSTPLPLGTSWTEPPTGLVAGRAYTNTNTTGWSVASWGGASPGVLTFAGAPAAGVAVTTDFSYFFPCRFAEDTLSFSKFMASLWEGKSVKFLSIK